MVSAKHGQPIQESDSGRLAGFSRSKSKAASKSGKRRRKKLVYAESDSVLHFNAAAVGCCNITKFVVATPARHRDLNIFCIFSGPYGSRTLSRSSKIVAFPALELLHSINELNEFTNVNQRSRSK